MTMTSKKLNRNYETQPTLQKLKNNKKCLLKVIRFSIPIVVLTIIFFHIDFQDFQAILTKAKKNLVILGFIHAPILIIIASLRWKILLNAYYKNQLLTYNFALKNYWMGLSLGFFSPASLGMDAFRIISLGRKVGTYAKGVAVIIVEKLIALTNCIFITLFLYPFVPVATNEIMGKIIITAYIVLVAIVLGFALIYLIRNNKHLSSISNNIGKKIDILLKKIIGHSILIDNCSDTQFSVKSISKSLTWFSFWVVFLLSAFIQVVSSIKSQIFFLSLGYDIPFIVNLFAAPTLYFIFMLPISFGSIGIREGVYIMLYGLFDVPKEIALIVSFLNFGGMILNALIGGVVMLFYRTKNSGIVVKVNNQKDKYG